jgi:peptidoglycan/LPS O-acetylase OafA/YrhL
VGVQLFFVLSGFLITRLLVEEYELTGAIRLSRFYLRRARRLVPALILICAVFMFAVALRSPDQVSGAAGSVLIALVYLQDVATLLPIAQDEWLGHTWSLAVEEQFYLVWPIVLLACLRSRRPSSSYIVASLVVAGTLIGRHVVSDPGLIYTALRWDAIAIGCMIALGRRYTPGAIPQVAAWAMVLWFAGHHEDTIASTTYLTIAVASAICVLGACSDPRSLTWVGLRHLGQISYGLYLWHMLVLRIAWHPLVGLAVAVATAEASYRWVEAPIRRRGQQWSGSLRGQASVDDRQPGTSASPR